MAGYHHQPDCQRGTRGADCRQLTDDLAFDGHDDLVDNWAKDADYPEQDKNHDLPRIAQYINVTATADGRIIDEVPGSRKNTRRF